MAYLLVIAGEEKGRRIPLPDSGETVLGRGIADINFTDGRLSRRHCAILKSGGRFILKDLQSTNGVFLNGERITENVLKDGDKVRLGYTVLEFREHEEETSVLQSTKRRRSGKTKIMAAKNAAMGRKVSDSRRLISAKGRFCEGCGIMIDPEDLEAGKARKMDNFYLCPECVAIVEEKGITPGKVAGYRKWKEQERSAQQGGDDTTKGVEPAQ